MELMFFRLSYCRAGTDPAGFSFLYHSGLLERSIKTIETLLTPWNVCVSDKNVGILFPTFYFQGYIGSVSEGTVTQSSSIW